MTTTDTMDMTPPPSPPVPPPIRRLRRSRTDRIGAGVAGGLGDYFRVDPVLFRVLFATAAFFGGAGVLAYLLAWAAIPEDGTERAAVDGWVTALRARRVPIWVVAVLGAVLFWVVAFSWWAPGPFFPVIAVVAVLVVVFGRRGRAAQTAGDPVTPPPDAPIDLTKSAPAAADRDAGRPEWVRETRRWARESRAASRARARRAFPVKLTTLLVLGGTLLTLALVDVVRGIAVPVYFWFALAVLVTGLLVGLALRRTPWSIATLLVPTVAGLIAFAGSHASAHDGTGQRVWAPTSAPAATYELAFGRSTLDLRSLAVPTEPRVVRIDQAAGQVRILLPRALNVTVDAHVHLGVVTLDGETAQDADAGVAVTRTVPPLAGATGAAITIDVHLADGNVDIVRS